MILCVWKFVSTNSCNVSLGTILSTDLISSVVESLRNTPEYRGGFLLLLLCISINYRSSGVARESRDPGSLGMRNSCRNKQWKARAKPLESVACIALFVTAANRQICASNNRGARRINKVQSPATTCCCFQVACTNFLAGKRCV